MSLIKKTKDKKVNFEFNKEYLRVVTSKIANNDAKFINDSFNDESLIDVEGFAENACKSLSLNQLFQFIRVGFCKTDQERNNLAIRTHK